MINYFSSKPVAERYSKGRPDFHPNTINYIREFLNITEKVDKALDIACGTGLSTKALLPIAAKVYGTDISAEMLNVADNNGSISYQIAPAEKQPFDSDEFDLVTVGSGLHWFNIDDFLTEVNRILKPKGWLVIYENYFTGELEGSDEFKAWFYDNYLNKFPSPPRNKDYDWSAENMSSKKFRIKTPVNFKNEVLFNKCQLVNYFTTQSNIISVVDNGQYSYKEIDNWLGDELNPWFKDDIITRVVKYGNWIKYLQKI